MKLLVLYFLFFTSLQSLAHVCDQEFLPDMNEISFSAEGRFLSALKKNDVALFMQDHQNFKRLADQADSKGLKSWINSPEKAAYAYQQLVKKNPKLMKKIMDGHPEYKNTIPIKGAPGEVVTFSFEKETFSEVSPLYFKPKKMTMEEWEAIDYATQSKMIKDANQKGFTSSFEKSELAYPYLGVPSYENTSTSIMVELKHHSFEITPEKIMEQVNQIAKDVKETHSFHIHVVFKVPEINIEKFRIPFLRWYQHVDDYVLLRGFEEGMHPGNYIEMSSYEDLLRDFEVTEGGVLHKFRSVGLRGGQLYGKSDDGLVSLGLEFRDSSRTLSNYDTYIKQAGNSASDYIWEHNPEEALASSVIPFTDGMEYRQIMSKIADEFKLDKSILDEIVEADQEVVIPFFEFEKYNYMNYRSGKLEKATPEVATRIQNARTSFIQELRNLVTEIKGYKASGKHYDPEEISLVVRMDIAAWAKQARASELLKNF